MAVKKLTEDIKKEAIALYNQGLSTTKLADKFNVDVVTMRRMLHKNNVQMRRVGSYSTKLSNEDKLKAIDMYEAGLSMKKIGKEFSTDGGVISRVLKDYNIQKRERSSFNKKLTKDDELEIIRLYPELTIGKLAEKYNVEVRSIQKILKNNQIHILLSSDRKKLNPEQEKEVVRLYQQGYSLYRLSKEFQNNKSSIKNIINKSDVELREGIAPNIKTKRKIGLWEHPRVIELYQKEEENIEKVAEIFEVHSSTITKILHKNNVPTRKLSILSKKLNIRKVDKIIHLYNEGNSTPKIAKMFKIAVSTVRRTLKKHGVEIKGVSFFKKKFNPQQESEVIKLYNEGLSMTKIASKLKTTTATISKIIKRNNKSENLNS